MEWHRFLSHLLVTEMLTVKKVWIRNSRNKTFFASSGGFSYCFTTYTPHAPTQGYQFVSLCMNPIWHSWLCDLTKSPLFPRRLPSLINSDNNRVSAGLWRRVGINTEATCGKASQHASCELGSGDPRKAALAAQALTLWERDIWMNKEWKNACLLKLA